LGRERKSIWAIARTEVSQQLKIGSRVGHRKFNQLNPSEKVSKFNFVLCFPCMETARHYREQAAQARRLAAATPDPELRERLEAVAREYDAIADRAERHGEEPSQG
jgi:hypothetical protein